MRREVSVVRGCRVTITASPLGYKVVVTSPRRTRPLFRAEGPSIRLLRRWAAEVIQYDRGGGTAPFTR